MPLLTPPTVASAPTSFFLQSSGDHRDLHSFPTRRSSDLEVIGRRHPRAAEQHQDGAGHERLAATPTIRVGCERSEEHTSELQSRVDLVCRLLLEKKNTAGTTPSKLRV